MKNLCDLCVFFVFSVLNHSTQRTQRKHRGTQRLIWNNYYFTVPYKIFLSAGWCPTGTTLEEKVKSANGTLHFKL